MAPADGSQPGMTWLVFALMTVVTWGLYGVFLHTGQVSMGDPVNGRYKAFLFVGLAYLITAVIGSAIILAASGVPWSFPVKGMIWSLLAGFVGAVGAFCVLLAFGAKGSPSVVMSIIFAGAPVINAIVALAIYPPAGGLSNLRWQFVVGILLAALGGYLVTLYKPGPQPLPKTTSNEIVQSEKIRN
jgi:drug/metabolite transporter (DMT)-like permease